MKKPIKKCFAILLVITLTLTAAPLSGFVGLGEEILTIASAATSGDYRYTVFDDDTAKITKYIGSGGNVVIPDTLDGYTVTRIGYEAFQNCDALTTVEIGNSVTTIDIRAFAYCNSLYTIKIPDSVITIGAQAFYGSDVLTTVEIGNSVITIGDRAFDWCNALTMITVSAENPKFSSDAYGVLFDKNKTTLIQYPLGNSRTKYTVPDSVTTIGDSAFYDCDALVTVNLGNNVTTIGNSAFSSCNALATIDIPDSVTTIGDEAFAYCYALPTVSIPDSVTTIGASAFSDCGALTTVKIGNGVTTIRDNAFRDCAALTTIEIPDSVARIGSSAFYDTAYYNDSANWENEVLYIGNHLIKAKSSIADSYAIRLGTRTIADSAFYKRYYLKTIKIPDSVTTIGWGAFSDCVSLTTIEIPDSVTSIANYAFANTAYSKNSANWENEVLYIGNHLIDVKSITGSYSIRRGTKTIADCAFQFCDSLTTIEIPGSVTTIGVYAFDDCDSLTTIEIPGSVTTIGVYAFDDCDALTSITVAEQNPNYSSDEYGVLYDKAKTTLIQYSIGNSRTEYIISDSVTTIGFSAFSDCNALTTIEISDSVTTIGNGAFSDCSALTTIEIPDSVTIIGDNAFYDCDALTTIEIPNSVTTIGDWAFDWCNALTTVYFIGTEEQWNAMHIGSAGNSRLINADIIFNYKPDDTDLPADENLSLRFDENIILLDIGESKQLSVSRYEQAYINGETVYSNPQAVPSNEISWSGGVYEGDLFTLSEDGVITGLSEGFASIYAEDKNDGDFCFGWVYVGDPQEFEFFSRYDTEQYFAENGFYSQLSSVSDCVEVYLRFSNKLKDDLANPPGLEDSPVDDEDIAQMKSIAPITLTAQIDGEGLSFDRNSDKKTYTATYQEIPADQAVDDLLMLFPYNLSVPLDGETYTVTVTLTSDSFETMTEEFTFTVENLESKSANEHIDFIENDRNYYASKGNFYGKTMAQLRDDPEYVWSKYTSLDFKNYHQVIFADILAEWMNAKQYSEVSLLPVVKEWVRFLYKGIIINHNKNRANLH